MGAQALGDDPRKPPARRRVTQVWAALVLAMVAMATLGCGPSVEDRATSFEGDRSADDETVSRRGDDRAAAPEVASEAPSAGAMADAAEGGAPPPTTVPADPTVTAGSVDDNEHWDDYLLYRQDADRLGLPVSPIRVEGRQVLRVVDQDGAPVLGAELQVLDPAGREVARLRTYADGRALFHPGVELEPDSQSRPTYRVVASKGDVTTDVELASGSDEHDIVLEGAARGAPRLDVLFLIDATGSMSDEIERLKANMISVAERIAELPARPDAQFALTVYRDRGDEYVTRTVDFTGDVDAFSEALGDVVADGGGDTPEALGSGLSEAIHTPSWRGDDAVKLVFLVADAAPHLAGEPGYEDEPDYALAAVAAAREGIKVLPVASSGLDDQGEYVFRQVAQVTLGRFVFLTYGPDGSGPGGATPHSVPPEDYDVLALDDLVVQLVGDELAHLA